MTVEQKDTPTEAVDDSQSTLRSPALLGKSELHRDRHDHRRRLAVQQRRRVLPRPDRGERGFVEERLRSQHAGLLDFAIRADHCFENHDALNPRVSRHVGILGSDILRSCRRLDVPAHHKRSSRSRRHGWRRIDRDLSDVSTEDTVNSRCVDGPRLENYTRFGADCAGCDEWGARRHGH